MAKLNKHDYCGTFQKDYRDIEFKLGLLFEESHHHGAKEKHEFPYKVSNNTISSVDTLNKANIFF